MLTHTNNKSGFSLIELVVAMFLGVMVVGLFIYLSNNQRKSFTTQKAKEESQESVSRIHGELLDKIRMAGYQIPDTFDAILPFYNPGGSDSIRVMANYDNFMRTNKITIHDSSTWVITEFDERFRYRPGMKLMVRAAGNDPIIEGWAEVDTFQVFSWGGVKHIIFYLDDPISGSYATGSRVTLFNSYTFKVVSDSSGNSKCLFTINGIDKEYVLVEGVEKLRLTYELKNDTTDHNTFPAESLGNIYAVNLEVESKAKTADYEYTHPDYGDNYRRNILNSQVVVLNLAIEKR